MNLPLFGAEATGLFADHGLDVELVGPARRAPRTPGRNNLPPAPVRTEFAITAVQSSLARQAQRPQRPEPRFVAVIHQRSPLAAFVPVDSSLRWPSDLVGARVAASTAPWFDREFRAGLDALGFGPPVVVPPREDGERLSLADGEVDVIGSWEEAVAVLRRRAGVPIRSIPFGPQVYTTGVVAQDHVPADVVIRMTEALRAAFEQQRAEPELGLDDLCRRYPRVDRAGALEEWAVLDDYVFGTGQPLAMSYHQWEATIAHAVHTYGFTPMEVHQAAWRNSLEPRPRGELMPTFW